MKIKKQFILSFVSGGLFFFGLSPALCGESAALVRYRTGPLSHGDSDALYQHDRWSHLRRFDGDLSLERGGKIRNDLTTLPVALPPSAVRSGRPLPSENVPHLLPV